MVTTPNTRGFAGETYNEVVRLSNLGWTRPAIATELGMTGATISYHRRQAFKRGDLERYATRHRHLQPEPAPAPVELPTPQPLIIRVPAGVRVEVIQDSPVGEIAFAT